MVRHSNSNILGVKFPFYRVIFVVVLLVSVRGTFLPPLTISGGAQFVVDDGL